MFLGRSGSLKEDKAQEKHEVPEAGLEPARPKSQDFKS